MQESIAFFIGAFISLFAIINPFSTVSVFHAITRKDSKKKNRKIAQIAIVISICVLIFFVFFGDYVLRLFNISIDSFIIASGILVFLVGYKMIKGDRSHINEEDKKHAMRKDDISIIPLAIPMISGPGAMATALVLMENSNSDIFNIVGIVFAIVSVCLITYFLLLKAHSVDRYIGRIGVKVIDKIMGLIVLVMGVQFIVNGLIGILSGLL